MYASALLVNTILGHERLTLTKPLAYYDSELITAMKRFILQTPDYLDSFRSNGKDVTENNLFSSGSLNSALGAYAINV